jgi:hypothetical protein
VPLQGGDGTRLFAGGRQEEVLDFDPLQFFGQEGGRDGIAPFCIRSRNRCRQKTRRSTTAG